MTYPTPQTLMPGDQFLAADLNGNGLRSPLRAAFQRPRAKLVYTGTGSSVSGSQPLAVAFGAGVGSSQYDDVWDGTTFADQTSRRGFLLPADGRYRIRCRWSWQDNASAGSGQRWLALYQSTSFIAGGSAIGNNVVSSPDPAAVVWGIGRRLTSTVCQAKFDITASFLKGTTLQIGVCQNSGVTVNWNTGIAFCWFSCHSLGKS